jgi:2-isopropylmalate synthase
VFTAFSGSHQDAIKKGFAAQKADQPWNVPYLPIDPSDVGRSYASVIRVNSQSGKGGIAYLMESEYGIVLPRRLQVAFARIVQAHADEHGGEVCAAELWRLFAEHYLDGETPLAYRAHHLEAAAPGQRIRLELECAGRAVCVQGEGNGPIDAAVEALRALGHVVQVRSFEERALGSSSRGGEAAACAFIELAENGREAYGVGIDANIVTASLKALVCGINRLAAGRPAAESAHRLPEAEGLSA